MNININNGFGNMTVGQLGGGEAPQQVDSPKAAQQPKDLTITERDKAMPIGEPDIEGVSDETLLRDDPLGKLVMAAFNLPPPPMPDFN